jgi:hypothetical protein
MQLFIYIKFKVMKVNAYMPDQDTRSLPNPGWEVVSEPTRRGGTRTYLRRRRWDPQNDPESGFQFTFFIVFLFICWLVYANYYH